jgi:hypothetical protein
VKDGIRDCRRRARDTDLANAACAKWRMFVGNVGVDGLDMRHVEMARNMTLGGKAIDDAPLRSSTTISSARAMPMPMMIPPRAAARSPHRPPRPRAAVRYGQLLSCATFPPHSKLSLTGIVCEY